MCRPHSGSQFNGAALCKTLPPRVKRYLLKFLNSFSATSDNEKYNFRCKLMSLHSIFTVLSNICLSRLASKLSG